MPACGPRRGSTSGPVRPIFIIKHSRPSRGAKPREADDTRAPQERPHQAASREAEISRRDKPHEALDLELMKMGRTGPPLEPRRRPQAGKSGDPRSQNANKSISQIHNYSTSTTLISLSSYLKTIIKHQTSLGIQCTYMKVFIISKANYHVVLKDF